MLMEKSVLLVIQKRKMLNRFAQFSICILNVLKSLTGKDAHFFTRLFFPVIDTGFRNHRHHQNHPHHPGHQNPGL